MKNFDDEGYYTDSDRSGEYDHDDGDYYGEEYCEENDERDTATEAGTMATIEFSSEAMTGATSTEAVIEAETRTGSETATEVGTATATEVGTATATEGETEGVSEAGSEAPTEDSTEKVNCRAVPTPSYYPRYPHPNADSAEYHQCLSPETLFFIFYYRIVSPSLLFCELLTDSIPLL